MVVFRGYHHAHLVSRDPEATANWYVKALGAEIKGRAEGKRSLNITLTAGEVNLSVRGLRPNETASENETLTSLGLHHFGLLVDDIEEAIQQWVEAGGELLQSSHVGSSGNLVAFVKGPENVMIELLQPR